MTAMRRRRLEAVDATAGLAPGPGWPAVARPRGGEVEEGVEDRVVVVGAPDEAGSDVWAVAQRERDHPRMCETVGDPGGQGGDGPAGGDDREAVFGGLDVIVGAGSGAAALLVERPERGPLGIQVRAAGKRAVEDVGHAQFGVVSEAIAGRDDHDHRTDIEGEGAEARLWRRLDEQPS